MTASQYIQTTLTSLLLLLPLPSQSLSFVHTALKKPSRTLAVSLHIAPDDDDDNKIDATVLSMQLRQIKAASLWTDDVSILRELSDEQRSAMGNFPGPCPVVYCGPAAEGSGGSQEVEEALRCGADSVVIDVGGRSLEELKDVVAATIPDGGGKGNEDAVIIWSVGNVADAATVADGSVGNVFYVAPTASNGSNDDDISDELKNVLNALQSSQPQSDAAIIASVTAMSPNAGEVAKGKELKTAGCSSILVKHACCGDGEDLEYATFVVKELSSKASSSFAFSGLTGSANGHFGGVAASGEVTWRRMTTPTTATD